MKVKHLVIAAVIGVGIYFGYKWYQKRKVVATPAPKV